MVTVNTHLDQWFLDERHTAPVRVSKPVTADHETAALGRRVTPRRTQTVSLALKDTSPQNAEGGAGNIGHVCLWNEQRALCR